VICYVDDRNKRDDIVGLNYSLLTVISFNTINSVNKNEKKSLNCYLILQMTLSRVAQLI
jgi:hypothetical protein